MRIGIIGFGFMGRMHWRCWQDIPDAETVAICDSRGVESCLEIAGGNIEGGAGEVDLTDVGLYTDVGAMLAESDVDAVSLTVPTFLHGELTEQAMAAGVNVLCEKPMALDTAACDRMIAAAELSGKTLMVAHCIRFWPEYAAAKQLVDAGTYGRLLSASFRRVGAPPTWGQMNWFAEEKRSGGVALDLHIHDVDFVQHLLGLPTTVESWGASSPDGALGHLISRYDYGSGVLVTAEGGWMMTPSFGFEMSFVLVLEQATIVYDCTRDPAMRICPADGEAFPPEVAAGDGYTHEIEHFAAVLRGESDLLITPSQARDAVRLVSAERESLRRGSAVSLSSV